MRELSFDISKKNSFFSFMSFPAPLKAPAPYCSPNSSLQMPLIGWNKFSSFDCNRNFALSLVFESQNYEIFKSSQETSHPILNSSSHWHW